MNSNEIDVHDQQQLASIESKDKITKSTKNLYQNITYDGENIIDSVACSKAICIATGNQIQLYNETYTEQLATLTLDCKPEYLSFSKNENFIIIADSMGRIHFFHLKTKNIIFSQQIIQPNKSSNSSCFLALCFNTEKESNIEELYIILRDYSMIKFSNIDFIKLEESITMGDMNLACEIKKNILMETIDLGQTKESPHHQSVRDIVIYKSKNNNNIIVAGSGNYSLSIWTYSEKDKKTVIIDAIGDTIPSCEAVVGMDTK